MSATTNRPRSPSRQAAQGAMVIMSLAIVAKLIAFAKELALARQFGVGPETDAYVLGFTWATWLPGIFISVAMATLIPIGRKLQHSSAAQGGRFLDEFAGLTLLLGAAIGLLTLALPDLFARFDIGSVASRRELGQTLPIMAALVPAAFIAGYCTTRLVDAQRHVNVLIEALPPLVIVAYLTIATRPTLTGLSIATTAGYVAYAIVAALLMRAGGQALRPRFGLRSQGWQELARASVIVIVGNVCAGSLMVADQFQASALGEGSVAILSFATRLLMLPATLASMAIARSLLPIFSDLAARQDSEALLRLAHRLAAAVFAIGSIGAALIWLLAPWLVEIAFERGSFTASDTAETAAALRWGVFQLPGFAAAMVLVQALLSQRRYAVVAASGIFNLLAKLVLNALLAPVFGVPGITLATAVVLWASFLFLLTWLNRTARAGRLPPDVDRPVERSPNR